MVYTCTSVTSSLIPDLCKRVLHMSLNGLWNVVRASNEHGNSVPLPSYIYGAFTIPVVAQRIREHRDLAVRVTGRCVAALVASKLAADINSRIGPISYDEQACLSANLGIEGDDVILLLRYPGAIEFTNIVFLLMANIDSSASTRVPSDLPDVVQQTFGILSQALPAELNATMRQDRTDSPINALVGQCELLLPFLTYCLKIHFRDPISHL
jgi:hypothetical protein